MASFFSLHLALLSISFGKGRWHLSWGIPLVWHGMKPGRKSLYHQRLSTTIYPAWVKHFFLFLSYFLSNVSFDKFGELKHGVGQTRLFISYPSKRQFIFIFFLFSILLFHWGCVASQSSYFPFRMDLNAVSVWVIFISYIYFASSYPTE